MSKKPESELELSSPHPRAVLRPLRQPVYDREYFGPGLPGDRYYMQMPAGGQNSKGISKSFVDTNLVMAGCLPVPSEFDLYGFQVEPDLSVANWQDWLTLYYNAWVSWGFSGYGGRPWLSVPLSMIPWRAVVLDDEELKMYASAITEPENDLWKKVPVITDDMRLSAGFHKLMTERVYQMTVKQKPIRVRSNEAIFLKVYVNQEEWKKRGLDLMDEVPVRMYMMGIYYATL
jgi:hypothetical protein